MAPSLYDVLIGVRQVALPEHVFLPLNETADKPSFAVLGRWAGFNMLFDIASQAPYGG